MKSFKIILLQNKLVQKDTNLYLFLNFSNHPKLYFTLYISLLGLSAISCPDSCILTIAVSTLFSFKAAQLTKGCLKSDIGLILGLGYPEVVKIAIVYKFWD